VIAERLVNLETIQYLLVLILAHKSEPSGAQPFVEVQLNIIVNIVHDPGGPVDFRSEDEDGSCSETNRAGDGAETGQRRRAQRKADTCAGYAHAATDIMILGYLALGGGGRIKGIDGTDNVKRQGDGAGK